MQAWAPRRALNEVDDVPGAQGAEVNALAAEAIDEELSHAHPVATGRADRQAAITKQELLEVGEQCVHGKRAGRWGCTQALGPQIAQQLQECWCLMPVRLAAIVAARMMLAP